MREACTRHQRMRLNPARSSNQIATFSSDAKQAASASPGGMLPMGLGGVWPDEADDYLPQHQANCGQSRAALHCVNIAALEMMGRGNPSEVTPAILILFARSS
jgi:hypothetical protein